MWSMAAVCAALVASSQSARGLTGVCDGLEEERPVRVVGVRGTFCVPLRPCEGSVSRVVNDEPLTCPRKGQRTVVGDAKLTRDSCCAVVDSGSGVLGCILAGGAEERMMPCLLSADWPRGRRTKTRRMQNVADDDVVRISHVPVGPTQTAAMATTRSPEAVATGTMPAPVGITDASVGTPSAQAATTTSATPTLAPLFTAATLAAITSAPMATATSTPASATAAPVNISSVPVSATAAADAPIPVPFSVSTTETASSTIDSASNSSNSSEPTSPSPLATMPLSESGMNTDGVSLELTIPPSEPRSDSGSTDQAATTIIFPTEPISAPSSGSDDDEDAESSLGCSTVSTLGLWSAANGSTWSTSSSASAAGCGDWSVGSSSTSGSWSDESILNETSGSFAETGSKSAGSAGGSIDEATTASSNGSSALSSSQTAPFNSSSSSGSAELSDSGSTAGNSGKNGSLSSSVESSSGLSRSSSSASGPSSSPAYPSSPSSSSSMFSSSGSLEMKHLTPLPMGPVSSNGVLQLPPIPDHSDGSVSPPSSDGSLSPVDGGETIASNAGANVMMFITVGSVAVMAVIFGVFYLRPKRANPHELLLTIEPHTPPMDYTGAYPYAYSLESEPAGPYDASSTPRL